MGTRKRFQCNQDAAAVMIALIDIALFELIEKFCNKSAPALYIQTANVSIKMMDGSAMCRRLVKNSAKPQDTIATAKNPAQLVARELTIQPTETNNKAQAITTKISLKLVIKRMFSSSGAFAGVLPRPAAWMRKAVAVFSLKMPAAMAELKSSSLYMRRSSNVEGINAGADGAADELLDRGMTCWKSKTTSNVHLYW